MFQRDLFSSQHDRLRQQVAEFLDSEIAPHYAQWEQQGEVPREAWTKVGEAGLLGRAIPKAYGGHGGDFVESVVVAEEIAKRRFSGLLTPLQSDIVSPFYLRLGNDAQKQRYLPGLCNGSKVGAIAMTEPQSGSDITAMKMRLNDEGEQWSLTGTKTHISNGSLADVIIIAARNTDGPVLPNSGISLMVVEAPAEGLERRRIAKTGMRALDTSELTLDGVKVNKSNMLGKNGMGFLYLMTFLAIERLVLAIYAQASATAILKELVQACHGRETQCGTLMDYQNTSFQLADLFSQLAVNQTFIDRCIADHLRGKHDPKAACIAKLKTTDLLKTITGAGLQLRGANSFTHDSQQRAGQDMLDSCVQSVWGGTSEVLRDVVGKSLVNWG